MPENYSKIEYLKQNNVFNANSKKINDELFSKYDFFDPLDMVQVKYEMIRRVRKESWSVAKASKTFGFSRPSYYEIQKILDNQGVQGLIPKKKGPKKPNKLTDEIIAFIIDCKSKNKTLNSINLKILIKEKFGIIIHPRSIEKALKKTKLKSNHCFRKD